MTASACARRRPDIDLGAAGALRTAARQLRWRFAASLPHPGKIKILVRRHLGKASAAKPRAGGETEGAISRGCGSSRRHSNIGSASWGW